MAGEKTEKATPKRRQDERKKGNVLISQEIVTAFTLLASFYSLQILSTFDLTTLTDMMKKFFAIGSKDVTVNEAYLRELLVEAIIVFAKVGLPVLLITGVVAVAVTMLQTRMLFSAKAFEFKGDRMNPLNGFKKMFSLRSAVEVFKAILKVAILLYVIYSILSSEIFVMPRYSEYNATEILSQTGSLIMSIVLRAGVIFVFIAAADYLYQWYEYEKNLKMTKQEIKDEYKQVEGDPQVKGHIRALQQQRAQRRMMQEVPNADVIIRNPTHFAVAIKYEQGKKSAPIVVAKGMDELALRIVKVAEDNGVYVTEDRPLARALYDAVEIGHEIPEKFYQAIAQVLAFVYKLKKKELK